MKVDPRQLQAVFLRPESALDRATKAQGSPAEDFAAILDATETSVSTAVPKLSLDESSASLLTEGLLGALEAGRLGALSSPATAASGVDDEVGSVLDILESYMTALADPKKTLKEIAPLADDLDRGATRLDRLASSLPEGDPLKGLTNETAALAAVEALKFRRGDLV
jgi:hypothetical protein